MSKLKNLITKHAGKFSPTSIEEYIGVGGYEALKKACSMTPEEIVSEVKAAKLLGRGGAGYPAGFKWEHLLRNPNFPKYIVCNADEGEPGTFKDKLILGKLPLKLIEGITIAGYVFGAKTAFIYVRGEYRNIQKTLIQCIENAKAAGLLGENILGKNFNFDIEVVSGAGAYVCGENSALLNSTEGKAGRPRIKPPHLADVGLFMQPTLVNNVETLATITDLILMGGEEFLKLGHPDSGGTKLVCLSGHSQNRGVFEVPMGGVTLRELIYDPELGGGLIDGTRLKFFHLGGQSGPIGDMDQLDTIYAHSELRKVGLSVGSGAVVVMNEGVSILEYLKGVTEFFIHECCGKCVPCREGNKQIYKILCRLAQPGVPVQKDLSTLRCLVDTMTTSAFCGLGQASSVALNSAWNLFKAEIEANVKD